ncbi:MAG: trans-aconitate 2-methyltransferase [Vicinamibacterales bacterium]
MLDEFLATLKDERPQFLRSVLMAREQEPDLFLSLGTTILQSLNPGHDPKRTAQLVHSYTAYTYEQNYLQFVYEASGAYPAASHSEANSGVYQNTEVMLRYMESLLLTQFLWPHHLQIVRFFIDRFLPRFSATDVVKSLELAPGHGLFGRLLLEHLPKATLVAHDISPTSIAIASELAGQNAVSARTQYVVRDALDRTGRLAQEWDAVISGELMEHLDDPRLLCEAIAEQLRDDGYGFLTAAITAANLDHVYEFKGPEDVRCMVLDAGLRIEDEIVATPPTIKAKQTKVPRVQAMIIRRA